MGNTSITTSQSIAKAGPPDVRRQLSLRSAIATVAGETIAVGIFLTPAGMAKALGSPFWLMLVWVVVGLLTLSGALTFGELAARFPRDGGVYVYLLETCGRRVAFLYGWMCMLVLDPGLTAALAVGLAGYASYVVKLSPVGVKLFAISAIWIIGVLNVLSIRISAGVLRWTTFLKLGLLAMLVLWAFALHLGSWSNFLPLVAQRPGSMPLGPALAVAMVGAFFSFGGWWDVSKIGGEVRDPAKNLPRAMLVGVAIVTTVYILVSAAFVYVVPLASVTSDETFVAQAGAVLFGRLGAVLFAWIVQICVFSSLAAVIMSAPRVYFAMAQDGLFLHSVARPHPRFGTPARAVMIQVVIASGLVLAGSFQQIISYFIFVAIVFLALAGAGIFITRRRTSVKPAYSTPFYPLPPIAFLLLIAVLLFLLIMHSPRESLLGTAVVVAGLPVYIVFERRRSRRETALAAAEIARGA